MSFDLLDIKERAYVGRLSSRSSQKDSFDIEDILSTASELKYTGLTGRSSASWPTR